MKKLGLILVGCLVFIGLYGAHADNLDDAVRAAVRRGSNPSSVTTRQKSDFTQQNTQTRPQTNRTNNVVTRNATGTRTTNVVSRSTEQPTTPPANVVVRSTTPVVARPQNVAPTVSTRTTTGMTGRTRARSTTTRNTARAATTVATREDILTRNYSKCKTVFNECMDEFCANKDTQLKRCACSSRINEFDKIKKQLSDIDEKMLDFNQRLLTVSMDKEDAAALNIATEGEKAFYDTKDVSKSKKTLDEIAKKLNTSFDSSNFSSSLGTALSWSLDLDSAFDTVDSLKGASTAAKSGTALYSAALPICREMAAEVCSEEDLVIAENGYQVLINQDCNTVEKTYKSAAEQARNKVLESAALLDMSRLNVYQTNNADDILTCKTKMLDMLTDSTVCGTDLGKCLDITGQYIDPSTGEAFLSSDLADLGTLISRPDVNETWSSAPGNATFVRFLNSKKKFLEPAMEHCVDIADTVWNAFVEDALSQIKIAQIRKLETVRQSCTTLTAQCLTGTMESIEDFDARALSIFGVAADTTVNAMCDNVLSSCTTLLQTTDTQSEWYAGMTGIQADITYDTIKKTCREVGRACVIQVCTSTSGNFGLCENISTSINRKSIINHTACWDEVLNCVNSAGEDALKRIYTQNGLDNADKYMFYADIYNMYSNADSGPFISNSEDYTRTCVATESNDTEYDTCIYDMCNNDCNGVAYEDTHACRVCRLAESIWGNCEARPSEPLEKEGLHNRIKMPSDKNTTTILSWFATNTNTANELDSSRDTTCGIGFYASIDPTTQTTICLDKSLQQDDCENCGENLQIKIADGVKNCCSNKTDRNNNCCIKGEIVEINDSDSTKMCVPNRNTSLVATFTVPEGNSYYPSGTYKLWCSGTAITSNDENQVVCQGGNFIVIKDDASWYAEPQYSQNNQDQQRTPTITTYFSAGCLNTKSTEYTHKYSNGTWSWTSDSDPFDKTVNRYKIRYNKN